MTNPGNPNQPRDPQGRFRKRWGWGPAAAVLLTSALVAGSAGAGAGGGAVGGRGTSASGRSSSGSQAKARARSTARVVQRLESRGLRVEERAVDADDDCAAHSYGQVRRFFVEHPCTALYRGLFEVRDRRRGVAVVAVAWVDMPDEAKAGEFQRLVDRHGTGNLTELTREGARPTGVRWTGEHYASVRDEATVVSAQAEPVGRTARAVQLAELASTTTVG